MLETPAAALVLIAVAVILLGLTLRDLLLVEERLTPARKAWLRIAIVFAAIAIGLLVVNALTS